MVWQRKDLLGMEDLSLEEAGAVFRETQQMPQPGVLSGKTAALLFFEPSTRTRTSFELAAKRLGAEVVSLQTSLSSIQKGESLSDTLKTLEAMGVDLFVIRHGEAGILNPVAASRKASLINAGDGAHEHPTQALLDLYTIWEKKSKEPLPIHDSRFTIFKNLNVVIVGDIRHSRVARSDVWGLQKLGARITLCGPATLVPEEARGWGQAGSVEISYDLEKALQGADVVNVLRLQLERQRESLIPSLAEYSRRYGLDARRLSLAKPDCLVLHPGPMNRGVEIASEVADGPQSAVMDQVKNGVRVRMAVMKLLLLRNPQQAAGARQRKTKRVKA